MQVGVGVSYGNLGLAYLGMAEYGKALEYQEKSVAIKQETGDRRGEGVSCGNLGIVYFALAEHDKAKEYLEKANVIAHEFCKREDLTAS